MDTPQTQLPPTPVAEAPKNQLVYASLWKRIVAACGDGLVLMLPLILVGGLIMFNDKISIVELAAKVKTFSTTVLLFLYGLTYEVALLVSPWRATLGMRAVGIKAQDEKTGEMLTAAQATMRHLVFGLSGQIPLLNILVGLAMMFVQPFMIAFGAKKQGIQDALTGTVIVFDPE